MGGVVRMRTTDSAQARAGASGRARRLVVTGRHAIIQSGLMSPTLTYACVCMCVLVGQTMISWRRRLLLRLFLQEAGKAWYLHAWVRRCKHVVPKGRALPVPR